MSLVSCSSLLVATRMMWWIVADKQLGVGVVDVV